MINEENEVTPDADILAEAPTKKNGKSKNGHANGVSQANGGHAKHAAAEADLRPISVPFNQIDIDLDFNVRTQYDHKEIQDLASSIDEIGLKTPLTVATGGTKKGKPYRLISGFRRSMALDLLKWGHKEVRVIFEETESAAKLFLSNLAENTAREDVCSYDQAKRYHELETGIAYGEETVKLSRKEIALTTSLSQAHIGNLVRSFRNLSEDSKKAWKKSDLPLSFVFQLARTEDGKPLTEEEQETELSEKLAAMQAEKDAGGRKRRSKKEKEDDENATGKAGKKDLVYMHEYLETVIEESKGMEKAYAEGKLQGIRFALGEIKRPTMARSYST